MAEATKTATAKACVILNGTLLPIDKITVDTPTTQANTNGTA